MLIIIIIIVIRIANNKVILDNSHRYVIHSYSCTAEAGLAAEDIAEQVACPTISDTYHSLKSEADHSVCLTCFWGTVTSVTDLTVCLSVWMIVCHLSVRGTRLSAGRFACPFIHVCSWLWVVWLYVCQNTVSLHVTRCLPTWPSIYPPVCLSTCLSVCLSVV